jgi:ubiquitin-protein ligase
MALGPIKRLRKELQGLEKASDPDITLAPQEDNIRNWKVGATFVPSTRNAGLTQAKRPLLTCQAFIKGPPETPFEGGESAVNPERDKPAECPCRLWGL